MAVKTHLIDTIADLTSASENPKADLIDGQSIFVISENWHYIWDGDSTATPVAGYILQHGAGGNGRFLRQGAVSNTGTQQVAIGYLAGVGNTGPDQVAIGHQAGDTNTGDRVTQVGVAAGWTNTGSRQTAVGYAAGAFNIGAHEVAFGYLAGNNNTGANLIAIGHSAGLSNTTPNRFIVAHAEASATPLLDGDLANTTLGIGVTPATRLDIGAGGLTIRELSADPGDPAEGSMVIWMSDGTGSGDDGDVMVKITAGAVTKTVTLIDYSAA